MLPLALWQPDHLDNKYKHIHKTTITCDQTMTSLFICGNGNYFNAMNTQQGWGKQYIIGQANFLLQVRKFQESFQLVT